jgi:hypothetical protein
MSKNNDGIGNIQKKMVATFFQDNLKTLPRNSNLSYSFVIIHYPEDTEQRQLNTVQVANDLLLGSAQNPDQELYHLVTLNCETFATFCRTGQMRDSPHLLPSEQIEKAAILIDNAIREVVGV